LALLALAFATLVQAAELTDLVKKLKSPDPDARRAAARELAEMGPEAKPAAPALIQSLRDKDTFVRRFSAQAIGAIGVDPKVGIPALVLALRDNRKEVQEAAAESLGAMGPNAVRPLLDVLKNDGMDSNVRRRAAMSLGKIGPAAKSAVPDLVAALQGGGNNKKGSTGTASIRIDLVNALGDIATADDKNAVSALQGITVRRDPAMTQAIRTAVRKIQARKS
jgi:HEAT repeat protein